MRSLIVVALVVSTSSAAAQVGNLPARSPYRDLTARQNLSAVVGYFTGAEGRAGVGPQAAPAIGARYELRVGGPIRFTSRLLYMPSQRNVVDPARPDDSRQLGETSAPLAFLDAGLSLYLTGQKSIWHFVPLVTAGVGIASDLGERKDAGGFSVGTPFALNIGGGVRYVGGERLGLRVDVADYMFRLTYPTSYFIAPSGGTPLLRPGSSESEWKHSLVVTVGVSYSFSR